VLKDDKTHIRGEYASVTMLCLFWNSISSFCLEYTDQVFVSTEMLMLTLQGIVSYHTDGEGSCFRNSVSAKHAIKTVMGLNLIDSRLHFRCSEEFLQIIHAKVTDANTPKVGRS
jgi:hypothetical protein